MLHDIIISKESVTIKIINTFLNEKILQLFQTIKLICIFLSTNQQYKLMKKDTLTEMKKKKKMKEKNK